ncbi:hypothetical protein [Psychrobacter sp. I-STPA10]|uniref:hypothetical protein n=1 Tax=Psychrobacter sp. I-STPA10 TaxID=2585769 RepID=UPI001E2B3C3D|nr:hypothetical protein [Psychrobacter sp. I-STPA10]
MTTLYFSILPIGFGIMSLVVSLICFVGFITTHDIDTKRKLYPWFARCLLVAFILLPMGIFFTAKYFI